MVLSYWRFRTFVKGFSFITIFYIGGLFILPFIYSTAAPVIFEIPRVWVFQRWVEILVLLILFFRRNTLSLSIRKDFLLLIGLFTLWAFMASFLGADTSKSISGNYYRGDGLMTFVHLLGFFLVTCLLMNRKFLSMIVYSISWSASLLALFTLYDYLKTGSASSVFFGNSRFLASYLVVSFPFLFTSKSVLAYIRMILHSCAILATVSLGGFIGITLLWMAYFLIYIFKKPHLFLAILVGFAVVGSLLYFSIDPRQQSSFESRTRIFTKGLMAWQQRPIAGWGVANFDYAFENVNWPVDTEYDVYVDKAHSNALEILVTTGIIGFLLYGSFNIILFNEAIRRLSFTDTAAFSLVFIFYHVMAQTNILSISTEVLFWISAAVLLNRSFLSSASREMQTKASEIQSKKALRQ